MVGSNVEKENHADKEQPKDDTVAQAQNRAQQNSRLFRPWRPCNQNWDENVSQSNDGKKKSRISLEETTHAILREFQMRGKVTFANISNRISVDYRRVYDILNVLMSTPGRPLVRRVGNRKFGKVAYIYNGGRSTSFIRLEKIKEIIKSEETAIALLVRRIIRLQNMKRAKKDQRISTHTTSGEEKKEKEESKEEVKDNEKEGGEVEKSEFSEICTKLTQEELDFVANQGHVIPHRVGDISGALQLYRNPDLEMK